MTTLSLLRRRMRRRIVWMLARQLARAAMPPQLRLALEAARAAKAAR